MSFKFLQSSSIDLQQTQIRNINREAVWVCFCIELRIRVSFFSHRTFMALLINSEVFVGTFDKGLLLQIILEDIHKDE